MDTITDMIDTTEQSLFLSAYPLIFFNPYAAGTCIHVYGFQQMLS